MKTHRLHQRCSTTTFKYSFTGNTGEYKLFKTAIDILYVSVTQATLQDQVPKVIQVSQDLEAYLEDQ